MRPNCNEICLYIYVYIWHKTKLTQKYTKIAFYKARLSATRILFITPPPPLRLFNNVDVHMQLNPADLFLKSELEQCLLGYLHTVINRAFFILFISFTWPGCLLWVNFVTKIVTAAPRELEGMQDNPGQESKWKSRLFFSCPSLLFSCHKSESFAVIILKTDRKTPGPGTGDEVARLSATHILFTLNWTQPTCSLCTSLQSSLGLSWFSSFPPLDLAACYGSISSPRLSRLRLENLKACRNILGKSRD